MKKSFFTSLMLLFSCLILAQTNFEKGYYIDIQNVKKEGYIKLINFDEVNNPKFSGLEFKSDLSQSSETIQTYNINEFGLGDELKMIKVAIDLDDVNLYKDFDNQKDLNYSKSTVFLNVLLEGKASLYAYASENLTKYFIKAESNNVPVQLIYKKYIVQGTYVKENNDFREQLYKSIKCEGQDFKDFLNVKYEKNSLLPFFEKYNKCQNSDYIIYTEKFQKSVKLNLTAFLGGYLNSFNMTGVNPATDADTNLTFGIGAEGEMVFPSEKWSVFASLDYNYLNAEVSGEGTVSEFNKTKLSDVYTYDSGFLDIVIGGRWYHSIGKNSNSKIFLGAGLGINNPFGSISYAGSISNTDSYHSFSGIFQPKVTAYFNFQVGYKLNNHYGINLIYDTNKSDFINDVNNIYSNFGRFGLNLRYTF